MTRRLGCSLAAGAAALVIFLLALAVATPASAAQLTVKSNRIVTDTAARCTTASVATTAPTSSATNNKLAVNHIPAACAGLTLEVVAIGTAGNVLARGTSSAATGTVVVTTTGNHNTANVARVAVFIGTWWIDATWTPPAASTPLSCNALNSNGSPSSASCTVTYSWNVVSYDPYPTISAYGINFEVQTTAANWALTVDFSNTSDGSPGWTPNYVGTNGNPISGSCTGSTFTGLKNPTWSSNNGYIQARMSGTYGTQLCPAP
ncbi:hypothetical protein [Demequina aurantiaca]|uniref:hypothetical protein n=1 Tax=Demequina aurantiaca TaxID=676200 RepID=UPI000781207E|nr:hypothetical protein [Demequina aurantiaca]